MKNGTPKQNKAPDQGSVTDKTATANAAGSKAADKGKAGRAPRELPPPIPEDLPRVSLLGRPNVGKSTLFNRLIRSNRAITHDMPGVTRDRMEGLARRVGERPFVIIDTGGITLDAHETVSEGPAGIRGFEAEILRQAEDAMAESSVLCLVVDAREGLTPFDEHLSAFVRRAGKPAIVAVNKVDGAENADTLLAEFYSLGLPLIPCSAAHGFNVRELEEELRDLLPPEEERFEDEESDDEDGGSDDMSSIRIAMLGRPNAGKSSLVNALSGLSRMIVSDVAGTTRDSVDVSVTMDGVTYTFVDTAGVRRPARITDTVEKYSVNSSLKSTTKAHVTLLVLDGPGGLTQQDKRLIELLSERMTAFMVLVNKSDLIPPAAMKELERDFKDALVFCPHVPVLFVSALKGKNLKKILPLALSLRKECSRRVPTGALNRAFEEILQRHQPPIVKQARAKFYYMTQAETEPPTFVFFVNDADRVLASYARYIEKSLRREFGITHAPVRVRFRSTHTKKSKK